MRLVPATEQQKRQRDLLAWSAWGQRLSPEQFVEREVRLRGHPWARAAMTTWLLVDRGEVLASCESFRMWSRLRGARTERPGACYGIASVLTEPRLRGRGHCTRMIGLLVEELRRRDPQALSSILFSDVGAAIYARAGGYVARPAANRVLAAEAASPEADALFDETGVAGELAQVRLPDDEYLVWPSAAQLDWHIERERAYVDLLGARRPGCHGARIGSARAFWAADVKGDLLVVTLLDAGTASEAEALLRAAARVAHAAGLSRVMAWEEAAGFDWREVRAGRSVAREGALPMIRPLDPEVRPEAWRRIPRGLWV